MSLTKLAVLDVDGTMYPGALGIELLKHLCARSKCSVDHAEEVFSVLREYGTGKTTYDEMARRAYACFAAALEGVAVHTVEEAAASVWSRVRYEIFPFVGSLIRFLKLNGFTVVAISGSPREMVELLATEIGIDRSWGAVFGAREGTFSGTVERCTALTDSKITILQRYCQEHAVDLAASLALGNSISDERLFEVVGYPFVFEPDADLSESLARKGLGVPVVERSNIMRSIVDAIEKGR